MKSDDIQGETLSLSTNYPDIEGKIGYLLSRCRVWRVKIFR
jgi:hypothetical protein